MKSEEAHGIFLGFTLISRFPQLTLVVWSCFTAPVLSWAKAGGGTDELPKVGSNGRVLEKQLRRC